MTGVDGAVIAVAGDATEPGRGIAAGLAAAGALVAGIGWPVTRAVAAEAVGGVVSLHGRLDGLVHVAPAAGEPRALADHDDASWKAACDDVLRSTRGCLQAASRHFGDRGGRAVVVIDTVAMVGTAGRTASAAAAEGQRALVKSAAKQWGGRGITVNCVAVAGGAAAPSLAAPALGRPADPAADVAPVVAFLLSGASRFVTGATLTLDGGVWMAT